VEVLGTLKARHTKDVACKKGSRERQNKKVGAEVTGRIHVETINDSLGIPGKCKQKLWNVI
jgi:hypothetical protein